jgi:sporulation protein YlmC with PRC-barrel domain
VRAPADEPLRLSLDAAVRCGNDSVGKLTDVVIDPASRRLTHLVVATHDKQARLVPARLVPAQLVAPARTRRREVSLTCSADELRALEPIRQSTYVAFDEIPEAAEGSDVGVEDVVALPSYDATEFGDYGGQVEAGVILTYDQIPEGGAELRRSSIVVSSDEHDLGSVDGFLVADGKLTHIVLERGFLWRRRAIEIPIDTVETIGTDAVTVKLSKDEAEALPATRLRHFPFL